MVGSATTIVRTKNTGLHSGLMLSSQIPQPIAIQQPISQNTEDSAHGSLLYTAVSEHQW